MIKDIFKKNIKIIVLMIVFSIIYVYRMFAIRPWYDELYTYYSFISRGPVYAGIHWPLPNNHVGYSVLSACLIIFNSPVIALRGVSFIASVLNIYLVYAFANKLLNLTDVEAKAKEAYGIFASVAYATVNIVHVLSVQGRGYSLSTSCFLVSMIVLINICMNEDVPKYNYVLYIFSLFLGIYLVPSSTFWVIPVCITGGVFLLINKKIKLLIKLILVSGVAALMDLFMYAVIWLAIGSNLLSKSADSPYYGVYQVNIIKASPFGAMKAGIDYMMASPYIQSIPRKDVIGGMWNYLEALFTQFYPRMGIVLIIFLCVVAVVCLIKFIKDKEAFLELFLAIQIIMLPLMMIIQSKAPYLRVYTFFGVVVSLSLLYTIRLLKIGKYPTYILALLMFVLVFTGSYNGSLGEREDNICDALISMQDNGYQVEDIDTIFYVDDYQKYILKYYYDIEPTEVPITEANYVMVPDESMNGEWPLFYTEDAFDREYIKDNYKEISKNYRYTIYRRF